jgi:hypothetical protein
MEDWARLTNPSNKQLYSMTRHLEVDRQVIPEEFDWILKESFIHAGFVEGVNPSLHSSPSKISEALATIPR